MRVGRGGEAAPNPKTRSLLMHVCHLQWEGCVGAIAPSFSVTLGHSWMGAGMGRWWGEEGGREPSVHPQRRGAVGAQRYLCSLSLLSLSRSSSPGLLLQCVPEYGHCCRSLRWVLLFLLAFAAGKFIFEPEQPHKQLINLFFLQPRSWLC